MAAMSTFRSFNFATCCRRATTSASPVNRKLFSIALRKSSCLGGAVISTLCSLLKSQIVGSSVATTGFPMARYSLTFVGTTVAVAALFKYGTRHTSNFWISFPRCSCGWCGTRCTFKGFATRPLQFGQDLQTPRTNQVASAPDRTRVENPQIDAILQRIR